MGSTPLALTAKKTLQGVLALTSAQEGLNPRQGKQVLD